MPAPLNRRSTLGLLAAAAMPALIASPVLAADVAPADAAAAIAAVAVIGKRWIDLTSRLSPVGATQIGDHRYDGELDDLSAAAREAGDTQFRVLLEDLAKVPKDGLSRAAQIDAAMLENKLRYDLWTDEVLQSWAWDALNYSSVAGDALYSLIAREFAPLPVRMAAAVSRMEKLPRLFAQARENLVPARVPLVHAQTYSRQNKGLTSLVTELVAPNIGALPADVRARYQPAAEALAKAVAEHQTWIDTVLVPNAKGDFRLGQKLYDEKLAFALHSPLTRQQIKERATAALAATRMEMYLIAMKVVHGQDVAAMTETPSPAEQQAVIKAALDLAAKDHPPRDKVVDVAREALAAATAFVKEKDLITLPTAPVQVVVMPEFKRGVAVAYCDPPGPLDKGLATFYDVSPVPDDWTAERAESFLREYNRRGIHDIATHEAMPGHYVQLAHSNAYPSAIRSVLWSGSFVEGWAVYAEGVMADEGFLNHDPLYKLVVLKTRLRSISNALLDQAIHVDGMTREDAMKLMMQDTFQEEGEAAGKWIRASVSCCQLPSYFVGYSEHLEIRKEAEAKWGSAFSLKRYHDAVLAFGSPPARFARASLFELPVT